MLRLPLTFPGLAVCHQDHSLPLTIPPPPRPPRPALQSAIGALQNVLSEDLKPADIEVGVVRADGDRSFKVLTNDEVDHFLSTLAERD